MPKQQSHEPVEQGSDNIFADLGFPNAEEHLVKAKLVYKIDAIMKKRRLKQVEAARLFGILQPDVSKMLLGEFRQFGGATHAFLVALGQDVEIVVQTSPWHQSGACASRAVREIMPVSHAEVMRTLTPAQRRRVKARAKVLIGEETAARYGTLAMLRRIAEALTSGWKFGSC